MCIDCVLRVEFGIQKEEEKCLQCAVKKMIENILHKWIQMAQHVKAHSKCMLYIFYKSFSLKRKFLFRVYVMHIN